MVRVIITVLFLLAPLRAQLSNATVVLPGAPPGGVGAACTAPNLFYANLTTGVLASCVSSVWTAFGTGGGGGTPGGSVTAVQFNNPAGTFAGNASQFAFDTTIPRLTLAGGDPSANSHTLHVGPPQASYDNFGQSFDGSTVGAGCIGLMGNFCNGIFGVSQSASGAGIYGVGIATGAGGIIFAVNSDAATFPDANDYVEIVGVVAEIFHQSSGTLTDAIGVNIQPGVITRMGTITNNYGLKVDNQTAGASNWAIQTGLGLVEFGDVMKAPTINVTGSSFTFNGHTMTDPGASGTLCIIGTCGGGGIGGSTKFTISGCSAGTTLGGATAGSFVSGTTGTCTVVITMNGATGLTATTGWACDAHDLTTPADIFGQTAYTTTTATLTATTVSGDLVAFKCVGF